MLNVVDSTDRHKISTFAYSSREAFSFQMESSSLFWDIVKSTKARSPLHAPHSSVNKATQSPSSADWIDRRHVGRILTPEAIYSKSEKSMRDILSAAGSRAISGGVPGMVAMGIQVLSLMWLRTTVNYQYRYGTGTLHALKTLYAQGGVRRFYRGVGPALIQGPMSRFGDTASNTGMLALLDSYESTMTLPLGVKTGSASLAAASFRILLMPVDTCKTILQVRQRI